MDTSELADLDRTKGAPTVPRQIAEQLRALIRAGRLVAGDAVPSFGELSTRLGVSTVSARHAVSLLEGEGLVHSVPYRGVVVGRGEPEPELGEWGVVPAGVTRLIQSLKSTIVLESTALDRLQAPEGRGNAAPAVNSTIEIAHRVGAVAKGLRAAMSAYGHRVHVPRMKVTELAESQETTTQGLWRRYNDRHLAAVEHLVTNTATVDELLAAFPTLLEEDAAWIVTGVRSERLSLA